MGRIQPLSTFRNPLKRNVSWCWRIFHGFFSGQSLRIFENIVCNPNRWHTMDSEVLTMHFRCQRCHHARRHCHRCHTSLQGRRLWPLAKGFCHEYCTQEWVSRVEHICPKLGWSLLSKTNCVCPAWVLWLVVSQVSLAAQLVQTTSWFAKHFEPMAGQKTNIDWMIRYVGTFAVLKSVWNRPGYLVADAI